MAADNTNDFAEKNKNFRFQRNKKIGADNNDFWKQIEKEKNDRFQRNKKDFYDMIYIQITKGERGGLWLTYLCWNRYDPITEEEAKNIAQYVESESKGHIKCEVCKYKSFWSDRNGWWNIKCRVIK